MAAAPDTLESTQTLTESMAAISDASDPKHTGHSSYKKNLYETGHVRIPIAPLGKKHVKKSHTESDQRAKNAAVRDEKTAAAIPG